MAVVDEHTVGVNVSGTVPLGVGGKDQSSVAATFCADLVEQLGASRSESNVHELMTRLLFCMFADWTGVWGKGAFVSYVSSGGDLGRLFRWLGTPTGSRSTDFGLQDEAVLPLTVFPYVGGELFGESFRPTSLSDAERESVVAAATECDWSEVSPAVFGSMFQSGLNSGARRERGVHYTSVENISHVLGPLFVDELWGRARSAVSVAEMETLLDDLRDVVVFDPACGCGNFLIVAYEQLRNIELFVLGRLRNEFGEVPLGGDSPVSQIEVSNFFGIEIDSWSAVVARVAMWVAQHMADVRFGEEFGRTVNRLPMNDLVCVQVGDALTVDWGSVVAPEKCSFMVGNPPFLGGKVLSADQRKNVRRVWKGVNRSGDLDFAASWFKIAGDYMRGTNIRCAFVCTSSVTQGAQPFTLWKCLYESGVRIDFGYTPFVWVNDARGNAGVIVVIIGFSQNGPERKRLFTIRNDEKSCEVADKISGYLFAGSEILVSPRSEMLSNFGFPMVTGSQPTDGGFLSNLSADDVAAINSSDSVASKFVRPIIGSSEFIHGKERWCLWLEGVTQDVIDESSVLSERVAAVESFRNSSPSAATRRKASVNPHLFQSLRQPRKDYLAVPVQSSSARRYLPVAFCSADTIALNSVFTIDDAKVLNFAILVSSAFNVWNRTFAGRLGDAYRVSIDLSYNTFPFPKNVSNETRNSIVVAGQQLLEVRAEFVGKSLAQLSGPHMPKRLLDAHVYLDECVLGAYSWGETLPGKFGDDTHDKALLLRLIKEYEKEVYGNVSPQGVLFKN